MTALQAATGRTDGAFLLLGSLLFWETIGGKSTRYSFAVDFFTASAQGFVHLVFPHSIWSHPVLSLWAEGESLS